MTSTIRNLLQWLVLGAACACGSDDGGSDTDAGDTDDTDAPTGVQSWDNWECTPSDGGCSASYESEYSMLCNPSAGQCSYGAQDASWSEICTDFTGSDCDACESAFENCARDEIASRE